MSDELRLFVNPRWRQEAEYGEAERRVIARSRQAAVEREIRSWAEYRPTPLYELPALAAELGLGALYYKDEGRRFGLGSFKALGGAYGVLRVVQEELRARHGITASSAELRRGEHAERVAAITVTCATDGNHGKAVAWGAASFGCGCVVYVPGIVSEARQAAIEAQGARVIRVSGTYDDAVRICDAEARSSGRIVVSDQSYRGYERIPRDIMQGYTLVAAEAAEALAAPPTHVFVQAGVGGLAAAVGGYFWERYGAARPKLVCVEPQAADCLLRTAIAGRPAKVPGDLDTVMACLSCGEVSVLAWRLLARGAAAFLAIDDGAAVTAMRTLARGVGDDPAIVAGESGAAGLAGLATAAADPEARAALALDGAARVLLFGTEGATDPQRYEALVGFSPAEVAARRLTRG